MKEIYNSAARKLKRIAFLSAAVNAKTAETADAKDKIAAIRKKNGRENRAENDVRIYNLNAVVSDAERSVKAAKAEIKTLRESALSELLFAYPLAKTDEHREKVRRAVGYATEGRLEIIDAENSGGVFGETEIVGAVTTPDRQKRGKVAEEKRAGLKDKDGKIVSKPRVVAYFYTKREREGIYRDADNSIRPVLKKQTKNGFFNYLKEAYGNKNTFLTLLFAALFGVFAVWDGIGVFGAAASAEYRKFLPAALSVATAAYFALSLLTERKGGHADNFALLCVIASVIAFICALDYPDKFAAAFFPVSAFILGAAFIIARAAISERREFTGEDKYSAYFAFFTGLIVGFAVYGAAGAGDAYFLTLFFTTVATAVAAAVCAFALKKKTGFSEKILLCALAEFAVLSLAVSGGLVKITAICALALCAAALVIIEIKRGKKDENKV